MAVAEQLRELPTTTLEEGEMLAVVIVGAVFPTETLAVELLVSPAESVAVPMQVTESPTSVSLFVTV